MGGPVVLAMVSQTAINLLDTIMVGRLPEQYSISGQAAIGHSVIFLWAIGGFLSAIGVGTQAIAARRFGEGRLTRSGRALTNSLAISVTMGTLMSFVGYVITPLVFPFFNSNTNVIDVGVPYCQLRMISVLSMVATVSFKSFFDGVGHTRVHMGAALLMNGMNVFLNWVFIFGKLGFPQMNVEGAGLASAISSYLGLFFMFAWTLRRNHFRTFRYYRWTNLNRRIIWEITRLSVPSGLATVAVMSGFAIFLKIVAGMDVNAAVEQIANSIQTAQDAAEAVIALVAHDPSGSTRPAVFAAGSKVIIDILSVTFMSCIAFGTATATLVSQSLGAKKPDLAARYGWESVRLAMAFMGVLGLLTMIFPDVALGIFSKDQAVIDASRGSLRMMGSIQPFIAAGLILTQALYGAGNTKYVMYVEMVLHFTCLIPLAYLMGVVLDWGLVGLWGSAVSYILLLVGFMAWKFAEGKWKETKI